MKKIIDKIYVWIFRKYIRKFLEDKIIVYQSSRFLSEHEIMVTPPELLESRIPFEVKRMLVDMADTLYDEGRVKIERRLNLEMGGEEIRLRLKIYDPAPKNKN